MAKFDEAVAKLKAEHYDSPDMVQVLELIVAQNERIKNLEQWHLEARHRLTAAETAINEHTQSITSLAKTRDEHETRVKAIEDKPVQDKTKIEDLDKRVTAVEGAVGSKAGRRLDPPAKAGEPLATDPLDTSAPKAGWTPPSLIPQPPAPDIT